MGEKVSEHRGFVGFIDGDGPNAGFINLDLVRSVDQIRAGHIRLCFAPDHYMEFSGAGAAWLLARIGDRAITADGGDIKLSNQNIATPAE